MGGNIKKWSGVRGPGCGENGVRLAACGVGCEGVKVVMRFGRSILNQDLHDCKTARHLSHYPPPSSCPLIHTGF